MTKPNPTVIKETKYILYFGFLLSVIMQAVFLVIGKWDYTVLFGNLLGYAASTGNFLLMGITVQKALEKSPEDAKKAMRFSQSYRMFMLVGVAVIGAVFDKCFNIWSVLLPLFFARIAVVFRPFIGKK